MTDSASGEESPSDTVCRTAEAAASFKSDARKQFGLSREKGGRSKGDGRTQNNVQTLADYN